MEVPQEPPRRQRGRSPQSITQRLSNDLNNVRLSNDIDNVSSNSHDSVNRPPRTSTSRTRVDTNMKADYDKIKGKLFQQQGRLNGEKLKVTQKKESCKKQINDLFAKLSELLEEKKSEELAKVDAEFEGKFEGLNELLREIEEHTGDLNAAGIARTPIDTVELNTIKAGMQDREDFEVMTKDLVFNNDAVYAVKSLDICDFEETYSAYDRSEEIDNETEPVGGSSTASNRRARGRVSVITNIRHEDCDDETPTPTNDPQSISLSHSGQVSTNSTGSSRETNIDDVMDGAMADPVHVTPTAPYTDSETADDPPPYWQAMGLEQPDDSKPQIPLYVELDQGTRLPSNELHFWHSFPIQRQFDRRSPLPITVLWNGSRICLADRANQKIKFFLPNGQLITEMFLAGNEIYDVAFLEEVDAEARYLVTCPRTRTYFIISINGAGIASNVRKFNLPFQYGCIGRGTVDQTLVGGDSNDRMGSASVDIFNFNGGLIKTFQHTKSNNGLRYPKAIETFESYIIVMDWRLHMVVVYCHNGEIIGEYTGTPAFPLCKITDITLDHLGNILILDEELSNIHVIDLCCNLLEVIKIPKRFSDRMTPKLISFDVSSKRLAVVRSNGDIAVFDFDNGYDGLPQRHLGFQPLNSFEMNPPRTPEVLPMVEGMLPSTIENIVSRPNRQRARQFNL